MTGIARWLAALAVGLAAGVAQAEQVCGEAVHGVRRCHAGLLQAQVEEMRLTQSQSQWCWAASVAMVYAHHGFVLPQERVVRAQYGELIDQPVTAAAMTGLLERGWEDDRGRSFWSNALVGNATSRRFNFGNDTVIRELSEERPLIIGALGHAMVLVQVEYEHFEVHNGVRITGATVIDPTPGRGVRRLTAAEFRPSYVAAVHVVQSHTLASGAATNGW